MEMVQLGPALARGWAGAGRIPALLLPPWEPALLSLRSACGERRGRWQDPPGAGGSLTGGSAPPGAAGRRAKGRLGAVPCAWGRSRAPQHRSQQRGQRGAGLGGCREHLRVPELPPPPFGVTAAPPGTEPAPKAQIPEPQRPLPDPPSPPFPPLTSALTSPPVAAPSSSSTTSSSSSRAGRLPPAPRGAPPPAAIPGRAEPCRAGPGRAELPELRRPHGPCPGRRGGCAELHGRRCRGRAGPCGGLRPAERSPCASARLGSARPGAGRC